MIDANYLTIKLVINNEKKDKLRPNLKSKKILKNIWNFIVFNNKVFILAKKEFINLMVRIMLENKCKAKVTYIFNDKTYSFT